MSDNGQKAIVKSVGRSKNEFKKKRENFIQIQKNYSENENFQKKATKFDVLANKHYEILEELLQEDKGQQKDSIDK